MELFEKTLNNDPATPLAERMRPQTLDRVVGQRQLLGEGKLLRRLIEKDQLSSLILWGPPGSGKNHSRPGHRQLHAKPLRLFFPLSWEASKRSVKLSPKRKNSALSTAAKHFCSSMKSIGSTKPSRMLSCPRSSRGILFLSARPPRIRVSKSTPPCSPAPAFSCSNR